MFIMSAAFSKFRPATGAAMANWPWHFAAAMIHKPMTMRGVKFQRQKIYRPFLHHVINRTNGNSISAGFFARLVNLKL